MYHMCDVTSIRIGKRMIATDPDFDEARTTMELRLTYSGLLMGTGNKSRPSHVHDIRRKLNPQLRRFWRVNPWLSQYVTPWLDNYVPGSSQHALGKLDKIMSNYSRCGYQFVPLVRKEDALLCAVDVLFLRPGPVGSVLNKGDIDGRLATLFDALSVPAHCEQLGDHKVPGEGEDPFFCLLADDSLVSQVSVETGELLEETEAGLDGNAARIVMTVRLSPLVNLGYGRMA